MRSLRNLAVAALILCAPALANAGDVAVKGVHLCCGACVSGVNKALGNVDGVSAVAADRDSKSVSFQATDEKAAKAGLQALADAGYAGTSTLDGKEIAYPATGAKEGATGESVTFSGVHLCCGACVKGAQEAVQDVAGVATIDIDRKERTVKLVGKDINVVEASNALTKAGFYGKVQ